MRRTRLWQVVALFAVIAVALGSLAQPTWLWQCRYASTVLASTSGITGQMPCRMVGADMASMPCCRHKATSLSPVQIPNFQAPACDPKLIAMSVDSSARTSEGHTTAIVIDNAPSLAPRRWPNVDQAASMVALGTIFVRPPPGTPFLSPPTLRGPPA